MIIGIDKNGENLQLGDICKFKINKTQYEGIIVYESDVFAFCFEMKDESFPSVKMEKADLYSIEKIISVFSTKDNDEYEFYRKIISN